MAAWEEERQVSKYAEGLEQLPADGRVIPMDPAQVRGRGGGLGGAGGLHVSGVLGCRGDLIVVVAPIAYGGSEHRGRGAPAGSGPMLHACAPLRFFICCPLQWHCAETGVTDNLWLNLSTGVIGSGRQVSTVSRETPPRLSPRLLAPAS